MHFKTHELTCIYVHKHNHAVTGATEHATPVRVCQSFLASTVLDLDRECMTYALYCECRQFMLAFMHKLHKVAANIMICIALGLGLPEDFFVKVK